MAKLEELNAKAKAFAEAAEEFAEEQRRRDEVLAQAIDDTVETNAFLKAMRALARGIQRLLK